MCINLGTSVAGELAKGSESGTRMLPGSAGSVLLLFKLVVRGLGEANVCASMELINSISSGAVFDFVQLDCSGCGKADEPQGWHAWLPSPSADKRGRFGMGSFTDLIS